jgi:hypothetical protein
METTYPDIAQIVVAKTQRRRDLAALSWEEKVAIIEWMQSSLPRGKWRKVGAPERREGAHHLK